MSTTDYISALNWGTSTAGAAGSAESSSTLYTSRLDGQVPPDQYTVSGLQITRLVELGTAMSQYFKGGTRLRVLAQTSSPFGATEYGYWTDNATVPLPRFSAGTTSYNLMAMTTIADPGTGAAIPVTTSGVCMITTAGAETNTLAIPTFVGQQLALICDTYVGNRVITCAQSINQANNTIMTFGAAADMIVLTAMKVGGAFRWRVTANDGVALS